MKRTSICLSLLFLIFLSCSKKEIPQGLTPEKDMMIPANSLLIPVFQFEDGKTLEAGITALLDFSKFDDEILFLLPRSLFTSDNSGLADRINQIKELKLKHPVDHKTVLKFSKDQLKIQYFDMDDQDQMQNLQKFFKTSEEDIRSKIQNNSKYHDLVVFRFPVTKEIKPIVFDLAVMAMGGENFFFPVKEDQYGTLLFNSLKAPVIDTEKMDEREMIQFTFNYFFYPLEDKKPEGGNPLLNSDSNFIGVHIGEFEEKGQRIGVAVRPAFIELLCCSILNNVYDEKQVK